MSIPSVPALDVRHVWCRNSRWLTRKQSGSSVAYRKNDAAMVEEQQKRCAKIAALLTENCPSEARFLANRAATRAAAPDNIKRLHAAG